MTEKKLLDTKLLYKFLERKCVLYAYITNVMERHGDEDDFIKLYEKSDILGIIGLFHSSILSSFDWQYAKEGFRFWYNLHYEFMCFKIEFIMSLNSIETITMTISENSMKKVTF